MKAQAGFSIDLSRIDTSDLSDEERSQLEADLEALFQPREDPTDLPKDLQIMAEEQLGEKPGQLHDNINKLRKLIEEEEGLHSRDDDLFLAAFLRGRKNDVDKAFQCIKNFYDFKARYPDLYSFLYPTKNPEVYDQQHFSSLPGTDRKGRKICCIVPGRVVPESIPLHMNFRMGATILELMLSDVKLQVAGSSIIFDMDGFSLKHYARMVTPTYCWHLAMIAQESGAFLRLISRHHYTEFVLTLAQQIAALLPFDNDNIELDIPLSTSFQMAYTLLETMLMDMRLQVAGTCMIFDFSNFSLIKQARLITPTVCWHMAIAVQDKIPMRLKAIHIINQPYYFNAIHAIFKTLLKKKLRKRIFLHGSDMSSLHKHIAPENLPVEWGGTRPPFSGRLSKTLMQLNEHKFDEWSDKGYKR